MNFRFHPLTAPHISLRKYAANVYAAANVGDAAQATPAPGQFKRHRLMDFGKTPSGNPYYVPEMDMFAAAAYAMRAKGKKGKDADADRRKAKDLMRRFKTESKIKPHGKKKLSEKDAVERRPFKDPGDGRHWIDGLAEAGLWDKDNPRK